jgi:hypothetical protein
MRAALRMREGGGRIVGREASDRVQIPDVGGEDVIVFN